MREWPRATPPTQHCVPDMPTRQGEVLRARAEAARAHANLGIDPNEPIDVFAAIRRAGIWLVFNEFDGLLGAMSREGVGGVMVNSARGVGMQRFTAAHELGHWYLHDGSVVWDTDEQMMRDGSLQEVGAQEFAAAFLMPRRLVNHSLRALGVERGGNINATVAYSLSRNLGVSYEGVLVQLQRIGAISRGQQVQLTKRSPASIKSSLVGGRRVEPSAQVWTPSVTQLDQLRVTVGDEIAVELPENRTTGYRWDLSQANPQLTILSDEFVRGDSDIIGAPGHRNLVFRADDTGVLEQALPLRRVAQSESAPAEVLHLRADVRLPPERENALILGQVH